MAMINAKEAQQYVYSMFMDGILSAEVRESINDRRSKSMVMKFRNYPKPRISTQREPSISFE